MNDITGGYGVLSEQDYRQIVNTPSGSIDYFNLFHKLLVNRAIERNGGSPINLLDVACGYGNELDFLKDNENVILFGIDISEKVLEKTRKRFPKANLKTQDVSEENLPFQSESMDVAIAVNAMAYVPEHMLKAIYDSLKEGGEAVVNFYDSSNSINQWFFDYHVEHGAKIKDLVGVIEDEEFTFKEMIFKDYDDGRVIGLGSQLFFQGIEDIQKLIKIVGFEIVEHTPFQYESPTNTNNETDVYSLKKPTI